MTHEPHTPHEALELASGITTGYGGRCLEFVRTCYGIGPRYDWAITAWNAAATQHSTTTTQGIPVGAPVFFAPHITRFGHVAIYVGEGLMRTTNSVTRRIHTDPVVRWEGWGYRFLGWTEDLNDVVIPGLAKDAGWYHVVRTSAGQAHANGYKGPSIDFPIKYRRKVGHDLQIAKVIVVDGIAWGVTKHGTYYKMSKLRRGKAT